MQARTLDAELAALHDQVKELRAENARLLRLLELTPQQARRRVRRRPGSSMHLPA